MNPTPPTHDRLLRVRGTVQGVGFRPFVARTAMALGVRGWVRNDTEGVLLRAVGTAAQLDRLVETITHQPPPAARVVSATWSDSVDEDGQAPESFTIRVSHAGGAGIETNVPVDLAPCVDCRRELADPGDRRHGYPFINCTQCGPRYSLIESLPYDRPATTMRCFRMCPECQREYTDPQNRRYHAEPNACPACGPELRLTDPYGVTVAKGDTAVTVAVAALLNGEIVAVKGVGGFHLMVDAQNNLAVAELRRRKHREQKPLAVMFTHLAMLETWAHVLPEAALRLTAQEAPIVLVRQRPRPALAPAIAPGIPWIGALLPSSPLHHRLLAMANRPLVATSANLSDEPLCTEDEEARSRLAGIADLFLGHNRPIARPVDDSVVRASERGNRIVLRRARGYAPSPLALPGALGAPLICTGAQMKNTVGIAHGSQVVLSPHIGDLDSAPTQQVFKQTIATLGSLFAAAPASVACDKHPDYASTRWALTSGLPVIPVQHHLAHVLAVQLEHRLPAENVLGVAWDGTGYGEDGTIWGGEFILVQGGRALRFGRLRPFLLPGGDAAVRDPRRSALSLLWSAGQSLDAAVIRDLGFSPVELASLQTILSRRINAPACSSAGRLFDAFGALLKLSTCNTYEGQTPLAVEIAAGAAPESSSTLPFPIRRATQGAHWEIDWEPALASALVENQSPAEVAAALHRGLAGAIAEMARLAGVADVVLAGGCFQNALLLDAAEAALVEAGHRVHTARELPPNDGAIAAGQALGTLWNLTSVDLPNPTA